MLYPTFVVLAALRLHRFLMVEGTVGTFVALNHRTVNRVEEVGFAVLRTDRRILAVAAAGLVETPFAVVVVSFWLLLHRQKKIRSHCLHDNESVSVSFSIGTIL